jgi:hypothetical protein
MALTENTLVSGYDLTATFGGYASALMQAIQRALPESTFGMILVDDSTPDISGSYAWRTRCLWIDTTDTALPVLKAYRTTGSPGWFTVADAISASTITTAMLQDGAVTLAKLYAPGIGEAAKLLRVNATGTGFELVSVADIILAIGAISITLLDNTGVGATDELFVGCIGNTPGENYWRSADDIAGLMSNAAVAPSKVGPATVLTAKTKFLSSRTGDTYGVYRVLDTDTDIDDGAINGDKLLDGSVVGDKLSNLSVSGAKIENATINVTTKLVVPSSSALKILGINSAGTAWELQTAASLFTSRQYATAAGSQSAFAYAGSTLVTYAHGLTVGGVATTPTQIRWVLIPLAGIAGWAAGEEVPIECFALSTAAGTPFAQDGGIYPNGADTTNVYLGYGAYSFSSVNRVRTKGTSVTFVDMTGTTWKIKCYASL